MMKPVVDALRDEQAFGLIAVARLEWMKFEAGGLKEIMDEYRRVKDESYTRLHVDHVPVIDEDGLRVDYEPIMREAIELGYDSLMVDGSRLPLAENIAATCRVVEMAHAAGIAAEAELGAIMGHEHGPLPPYEELFKSGRGFTDPDDAARFVVETRVDWLSVAAGNIHGAISAATRSQKKITARLSIERIEAIRRATGVPLVLHGGTGISKECTMDAVRHGVAKINIATAIRQPYEAMRQKPAHEAATAVYDATREILRNELELTGSAMKFGSIWVRP